MFIQTELTPNPNSLKFLPGKEVLGQRSLHFANSEEAQYSPIAKRLFQIEGVESIFLGSDFITVSKKDSCSWDLLKPYIIEVIIAHYLEEKPIISEESESLEEFFDPNDAQLVKEIKALLDNRIRPAVAQDGGDIVFRGFKEGVVYLGLRGACSGCPSSTATLKMGIENMLKHYIPEIQEVQAFNGED